MKQIKGVKHDFRIAIKAMAEFEKEEGIHAYQSKWYTIAGFISDRKNPFHSILLKYKGHTKDDFLAYLDECGIPYSTNEMVYEIAKELTHSH